MSEINLKLENSLETYFTISICMYIFAAIASLWSIANSKTMVPAEVLAQSYSVITLFLITIIINGFIFKFLERFGD